MKELKVSELVDFVHEQGKWQDDNCFKTQTDVIGNKKDFMVISNHDTYGSKDDMERCNDYICLQKMYEGYWIVVSLCFGMIDQNQSEKINCLANILYAMQFKKTVICDVPTIEKLDKKLVKSERKDCWEQLALIDL